LNHSPPIITLTTDFGTRDYHLALIKASILRQTPHAQIVDISNDIRTYDIVEAAFIFRNAWAAFPVGTIHLLSVHDFAQGDRPFLVFSHAGHHFVGPDNGLFSLIFPNTQPTTYQISTADLTLSTFPIADVLGKASGHLAQDFPAGALGTALEKWLERITFRPVTGPNHIRGSVVYIDKFDNAVLNINRALFEQVGQGRDFELFFKAHSPITTLSDSFHDVPVGELLCRFNAADLLEIAINLDRAATLLGLKVEDTIQLDFKRRNE
jgi:S-adenosylmethionine hydrolase